MFKTSFAFLLLLILLPSMIYAQTLEPTLWPPDPTAIFAPGVEVLNVEIKEPRPYNPPTYDNETRIVRVWDEAKQQWQEFPYPDEVQDFVSIEGKSPTIVLYTKLVVPFSSPQPLDAQWLLNTDIGEFSRPELACGELRGKVGHGHWIIEARDDNKTFFLCNSESGKEIGPLPLQKRDYLQNASTSPDGKHVAMFGNSGLVYSYAFDTNTLIELGSTQGYGTQIQILSWIDNNRIFIYTTDQADMSFPWRNYFLADATQTDSLKGIAQVIKPDEITSLDHPRRTQWITHADDKCFFTELNWETAKITDYGLDGLCSEGTVIPDGTNDRLYFEFNWPDDAFNDMGRPAKQPLSSKLVRYNPFTNKRIDLLKGEIEWVEDISPNGRFAVVMTDDDGCFEAYPREDPMVYLPVCESQDSAKPKHVVIDLKTGVIVYQQTTAWEESISGEFYHACYDYDAHSIQSDGGCISILSAGPSDSWMFIDDDLLLQAGSRDGNAEYTLLNLRGNKPQKWVIGQAYELRYLSASQQFLVNSLLWSRSTSSGTSKWALFDTATGKQMPFLRDGISDQYNIDFGIDTADTLTVTLSKWVNQQPDSVEEYFYTIRLPKITT
ncbi:MAG: hypothetical protein H0X30_10415 [Anaerolineae bacterium]|nr:hypothetical protein [Anaerolineae bacterium]